mmetsp:Transcript_26805/g.64560  ORF Transcript_26805/g.64560 Transcript_26805/m.64560 type:complete len:270 (-) Transcript_26805:266-1075(-)
MHQLCLLLRQPASHYRLDPNYVAHHCRLLHHHRGSKRSAIHNHRRLPAPSAIDVRLDQGAVLQHAILLGVMCPQAESGVRILAELGDRIPKTHLVAPIGRRGDLARPLQRFPLLHRHLPLQELQHPPPDCLGLRDRRRIEPCSRGVAEGVPQGVQLGGAQRLRLQAPQHCCRGLLQPGVQGLHGLVRVGSILLELLQPPSRHLQGAWACAVCLLHGAFQIRTRPRRRRSHSHTQLLVCSLSLQLLELLHSCIHSFKHVHTQSGPGHFHC